MSPAAPPAMRTAVLFAIAGLLTSFNAYADAITTPAPIDKTQQAAPTNDAITNPAPLGNAPAPRAAPPADAITGPASTGNAVIGPARSGAAPAPVDTRSYRTRAVEADVQFEAAQAACAATSNDTYAGDRYGLCVAQARFTRDRAKAAAKADPR